MAAPIIESVFPSNGASGAILATIVWAILDHEIDSTSIAGAFFVVGPDNDLWTGPDMKLWEDKLTPAPDHILRSPGYKGIVEGTISIQKLDSTGNSVSDPSYSPSAALYKNKIIFTPSNFLAATTDYNVILAGREAGSTLLRGIRTRSVFDTQLGTNLGDGNVVGIGGYTGTVTDSFAIEITTAGGIGEAKYQWYRTSVPTVIRTGTVSGQTRQLSDGVSVYFTGTDFRHGDTYTIAVAKAVYMSGIYTWSFSTGTGSIDTVPSTTSTSPTGVPVMPVPPFTTSAFAVEEIAPTNRATKIPLTQKTIQIIFTHDIDADTITQESVRVYAEPIDGEYDENVTVTIGEIAKTLSVSGDVLTITI